MSRVVIVGDVHGMLDALRAMVSRLALEAGDRLVMVGDLVDKGPDPAGVVDYLAELAKTAPYEIVLLDGNHEDRHRRYQRNVTERPRVAKEQAGNAPELPALDAELSEAGRAFLNTGMPFHRVPEHSVLVVHGGIPGDMRRFPASVAEVEALEGKARDSFRRVLRTRYIDGVTGRFVVLGQETPGDVFWAERYDGRFGHVVFGHHPFMEGPKAFAHATGIDTGAVHGGGLTALVLEADGRRHFVQVPTPEYIPKRGGAAP